MVKNLKIQINCEQNTKAICNCRGSSNISTFMALLLWYPDFSKHDPLCSNICAMHDGVVLF